MPILIFIDSPIESLLKAAQGIFAKEDKLVFLFFSAREISKKLVITLVCRVRH